MIQYIITPERGSIDVKLDTDIVPRERFWAVGGITGWEVYAESEPNSMPVAYVKTWHEAILWVLSIDASIWEDD